MDYCLKAFVSCILGLIDSTLHRVSKGALKSVPEPTEHQSAEIKRVCFDPSETQEDHYFCALQERLFNSSRVSCACCNILLHCSKPVGPAHKKKNNWLAFGSFRHFLQIDKKIWHQTLKTLFLFFYLVMVNQRCA